MMFCTCTEPAERLPWIHNKTTGRQHCANCSGAMRPDQDDELHAGQVRLGMIGQNWVKRLEDECRTRT